MEAAERHDMFMEEAMAEVRLPEQPAADRRSVLIYIPCAASGTCVLSLHRCLQAREALAEQEVPIGCAHSSVQRLLLAFCYHTDHNNESEAVSDAQLCDCEGRRHCCTGQEHDQPLPQRAPTLLFSRN